MREEYLKETRIESSIPIRWKDFCAQNNDFTVQFYLNVTTWQRQLKYADLHMRQKFEYVMTAPNHSEKPTNHSVGCMQNKTNKKCA